MDTTPNNNAADTPTTPPTPPIATKKCKYCQVDIPFGAKICPNCKKKQSKPIGCLIAVIAVLLIIIVGAAAGSGGKSESSSDVKINKNSESTAAGTSSDSTASSTSSDGSTDDETDKNTESAESEDNSDVVELGDSFEANGLKVSFTNCELDYKVSDDEFDLYKPSKGKKYISLSFTFENTGDDDKYVSIYDFKCYADNKNCEQKFLPGDDDFIGTDLSKGRNVSFIVFYEVPIDAKEIELEYESDIWTDEKVIIKAK